MKIHLTNWGSSKAGPGRKWTIMAIPREWEHGEGKVPGLIPEPRAVIEAHKGTLSREEYRARFVEPRRDGFFLEHECRWDLTPGKLLAFPNDEPLADPVPVADGDTLCCACSSQKAAQTRCHRTLSAALLASFGWDVLLDGRPFPAAAIADTLMGKPLWDGRADRQSVLDMLNDWP